MAPSPITKKRVPAEVFPPGEFIREELEALGWSQADLAKIIGQDPSNISKIISGQTAITPTTAKQLEEALGIDSQYWMNLETAYRLAIESEDMGHIRQAAKLYALAPIREMERRGWIEKTKSFDDLERELKRFFQCETLDEMPRFKAAARASIRADDGGLTVSQNAWCYKAARLARAQKPSVRYTKSAFDKGLLKMRELLRDAESIRLVPRVLSEMGIRFVIVEDLAGTKIDGAAFWLERRSPAIALTLRYGRIDNFWFTLAHELSHIRHEDATTIDIDLVGEDSAASLSDIEKRADAEAAETLIPGEVMRSFILRVRPFFSKDRIEKFASLHRVHPGIVVGQIGYREKRYNVNRELLVDIRGIATSEAATDGWDKTVSTD